MSALLATPEQAASASAYWERTKTLLKYHDNSLNKAGFKSADDVRKELSKLGIYVPPPSGIKVAKTEDRVAKKPNTYDDGIPLWVPKAWDMYKQGMQISQISPVVNRSMTSISDWFNIAYGEEYAKIKNTNCTRGKYDRKK